MPFIYALCFPSRTFIPATGVKLFLAVISSYALSTSLHAVEADPANDVIWRIGQTDGSDIEFAPESQREVVFKIGDGDVSKDFPGYQEGTTTWTSDQQGEKPYHVDFDLAEVPAGDYHLALHLRFKNAAPSHIQVVVNDRKGIFPVIPVAAEDADSTDGNFVLLAKQDLTVPIRGRWLKQSGNRITIAPLGFGSMYYDSLEFRRGAAAEGQNSGPRLRPTVFYVNKSGELVETCKLLVPFETKLANGAATIRLGDKNVETLLDAEDYEFGVLSTSVDVPALDAQTEAEIKVTWNDRQISTRHSFKPARRWKVFLCPKVHNDVGYTDLQPHVNELDNRNTDTILSILTKFPFYKFNFETSWLVDNYLDCRTATDREALLARAREGRAAFNAFYLNIMTGICTGEEIYRSLYYTQKLHREHGTNFDFACLTDAPSHSWFLPTLLKDVGIKGFANGSNQGRAPILVLSDLNEQSPFYWEGINGERILMFYARAYAQWKMLTSSGFIGASASYDYLKNSLPQMLVRFMRDDYVPDAVMAYGAYIDNAAIPPTGEAEFIAGWNEEFAYPQLRVSTDKNYFDYIDEHFAGKLPVYRGDSGAYWEDGATSSAEATTWNRETKQTLPVAETSSSFATLFEPRYRYPSEDFHDAWTLALFYDEHTWGAFNSISQPHREGVLRQWEVKESYSRRANLDARNLLARSLNRLCEQFSLDDSTILTFNWQNRVRSQVLETELNDGTHLIDLETNEPVPVDVIHKEQGWRRVRFLARDVPAMGYRGYAVRMLAQQPPAANNESSQSQATSADQADDQQWVIENDYYRLEVDPTTGGIRSLRDKAEDRELVDSSSDFTLNQYLYVSGSNDQSLMPNLVHGKKPADLTIHQPEQATLVERVSSPLGERLIVTTRAEHTPEIRSEYLLYDHAKRVDIVNTVQKEAVLDKEAVYFAFPFAAAQPQFAYQIQNGWVRPNKDQLPGACREWFSPQNVVHLSDGDYSIAWASPDAPLITLVDINRGLWLRKLDVTNGAIFSYVMNNYWWTNYRAEQGGEFKFRYSITSGDKLSRTELAAFDADTRSPVLAYPKLATFSSGVAQTDRRLPAGCGSLMQLADPNLQVVVLKQAEDSAGWILRLQEIAGQSGAATLKVPFFPVEDAQLCNGVEVNQRSLEHTSDTVSIPYEPNRYITVRLRLGLPRE